MTVGATYASPMNLAPEDVLTEWFGDSDTPTNETRSRWFTKDPAFDARLRDRFGEAIGRGARGELDAWAETPRGALALVILLDQFSRNVHRGTPRSFAQDEKALAVSRASLRRGDDRALPEAWRSFLYMPFMHSEDLAAQDECVRLFEASGNAEGADYARRHRDIVARFGRFPHRNVILERTSTGDEIEFLKQPGSSF